jgi:hypothetical protein
MFAYLCSKLLSSQVFLNMLVKVTRQDLPLWHQILVLEILRVSFLGYNSNSCLLRINLVLFVYQGFCVEACTLRLLFQTFDMYVLYR